MAEPIHTPKEAAQLAALAVRGSYRVSRGKPTGKVDSKIDEIRAAARLRAEMAEEARRAEKDKRLRDEAAKKAAKRR